MLFFHRTTPQPEQEAKKKPTTTPRTKKNHFALAQINGKSIQDLWCNAKLLPLKMFEQYIASKEENKKKTFSFFFILCLLFEKQ
jgi:hypothetical protein